VGQIPSGSKDPFALRRSALGILRIIIEKDLDLDLEFLINEASGLLGENITNSATKENVFDFILSRYRDWYKQEGVDTDVIIAVESRKPTKPRDFNQRVKAIAQFKLDPAAVALAAANKRVSNILKKASSISNKEMRDDLLLLDAEKALAIAVKQSGQKASLLFTKDQYSEGLELLATLRPEVDQFFDEVMVMDENEEIRDNNSFFK